MHCPVVFLPFVIALTFAPIAFSQPIQEITLRGDAGGKRFDGIGAVNGGGATSVLLKDYPAPQRSQILDIVYKPMFGASVSALLVEIPGDGNSTQGSILSHMRTRDDLDFTRGYTWWILREAKKRKPALIEGQPVLTATDKLYTHGMAGILAGQTKHRISTPWFDNLAINAVNAPPLTPSLPSLAQTPIYFNAATQR